MIDINIRLKTAALSRVGFRAVVFNRSFIIVVGVRLFLVPSFHVSYS